MKDLPRNAPCPCGSGRKYKHCCLRKDEAEAARGDEKDEKIDGPPFPLHLLPPIDEVLDDLDDPDSDEVGASWDEDDGWDEGWDDDDDDGDEDDLDLDDGDLSGLEKIGEINDVGYDAEVGPIGDGWRDLDSDERGLLVAAYHWRIGDLLPERAAREMHNAIHATVETQVLTGEPPEAKEALDRLRTAGIPRHAAIHAIGEVMATTIFDVLKQGKDGAGTYERGLAAIDPQRWLDALADEEDEEDDDWEDDDRIELLDYDPELLEDLAPYDEIDGFTYDADRTPDPERWQALSHESQRLAVAAYHRRIDDEVAGEDERVQHGLMHLMVEDHLARGEIDAARDVLARFRGAGVARHAAVHAIGAEIFKIMKDLLEDPDEIDEEGWLAALAAIDPEDWRDDEP